MVGNPSLPCEASLEHSKERFRLALAWNDGSRTMTTNDQQKSRALGRGKAESGFKMNVVNGHSIENVAVMRGFERHIDSS